MSQSVSTSVLTDPEISQLLRNASNELSKLDLSMIESPTERQEAYYVVANRELISAFQRVATTAVVHNRDVFRRVPLEYGVSAISDAAVDEGKTRLKTRLGLKDLTEQVGGISLNQILRGMPDVLEQIRGNIQEVVDTAVARRLESRLG